MVLKTLQAMGPLHGYGIARRIEQVSEHALELNQGTIYASLLRLVQKGWIKAQWGQTPNNQRARYYTITPLGQRQLGLQEAGFAELLDAIGRVMRPA